MRKFIAILLLLLLASPLYAWSPAMQAVVSGGGATVATDSCTGGLTFSWHMENDNVTLGGVAGGVNNGCTAGDATATYTGTGTPAALSTTQKQDGSKSLYSDYNINDYPVASFDSASIITSAAGRIKFYVYFPSAVGWAAATLFRYNVDASNYVKIASYGTDDATGREIRITVKGSVPSAVTVTATTTAADMAEDTWYLVDAAWTAGDKAHIQVDATGVVDSTGNCASFTTEGTTFQIGQYDYPSATAAYFDGLKIYSAE